MKIGNTWRLLDWWADTNGIGSVGGAPFTPAAITGLKLWLKADAGTFQDSIMTVQAVSDADPVGGWQDQSGNGKHVYNITSTQRLTLQTGANGQNGRAVVRGDGVDDYLSSSGVASVATDNFTVFVASKIRSTVGTRFIFFNGGTGGVAYGTNGTNRTLIASAVAFMADGAYVAGTFEIATYKRAAGTTTLAINGANQSLTAPTTTPLTPTGTTVFTRSPGEYPDGDLGEVLLYDAALTAGEITQVETYLNARWAAF